MLIIGSHALSSFFDIGRKPQDLDVITTRDLMEKYLRNTKDAQIIEDKGHKVLCKSNTYNYIEFEFAENGNSAEDYYKCCGSPETLSVAPISVLFSLKRSHINFPKQFEKHIHDYHLMLPEVVTDRLSDITKKRRKEIESLHGKLKTPSLQKKTDDFFDDNVSNKIFIHDHIHAVMAHREKPMFEYIKPEQDKVTCSKDLWLELDYEDKIKCVLEEAYVIALERGVIPMIFHGDRIVNSKKAFKWALMRICTNLCSGWFRTFAVDNYFQVLDRFDEKYVEKFLEAYHSGRIKKISS